MSKPRFGRLGVILVAALPVAATACDDGACSLVGCEDGLELTLRPATGAFDAGAYRLRVTGDAVTLVDCELDLAVEADSSFDVGSSADCGARLSIREGSLVAFTPSVPAGVRVVLDRDGDSLVDETLEPEYEDVYPNGPECGVGCRTARVELAAD